MGENSQFVQQRMIIWVEGMGNNTHKHLLFFVVGYMVRANNNVVYNIYINIKNKNGETVFKSDRSFKYTSEHTVPHSTANHASSWSIKEE